jgi:anti-sigma regulatory factor (Ser/Thr protein kinase)
MNDAMPIVTEPSGGGRADRAGLLTTVCAAGGFSATLGLVVLFGWHTHTLSLLRIVPAFVAMAYNTALGFLLCGLGLMAVTRGDSRAARLAARTGGALAVVIGLLTLSEYLLGVSLGIDELLMKAYVRSGVTAPGRMAFCTALCFSLAGSALVLGGSRRFPCRPLLTAVFGSVVIGLGVIALSGYFTGIVPYYTWGQFTRMAVHTASGFLVLGCGVVALAWRDDRIGRADAPRWLPLLVGVGAAAVTLCLWQALVVEERAQLDLIRRLAAQNTHLHVYSLSRAQSLLPLGALAGGLLLAALLAWTVGLAQTARRQAGELGEARDGLERRVAERTSALAEANEALEGLAGWQRGFLRDVLASVTDGKLRLCGGVSDLPPPRGVAWGEQTPLTGAGGLRDLRCRAVSAAEHGGFPDERLHDLVTAVNEAGMNAIVHAGGGAARVRFDPTGTVQVWVEDAGQGITLENLPRATLARGFTTAGTLGHGLKLMLQTTDRLWLLTGPTGTTVVLEQDRQPPEPAWMQR